MKFEDIKAHLNNVKSKLSEELLQMRTGRASVALVEDIKVEAYAGSNPLPIKELASITIPDAQSVLITPWDKSILKQIETALNASGKNLNAVNEGDNLRVPVPALTEETRKEMAKRISLLVEQSKIRIRTLRQDVIKSVEEQEENGIISEDEMFQKKKEIEDTISKANQELEDMGEKKKIEIMKV